jgi:hypothetical protein
MAARDGKVSRFDIVSVVIASVLRLKLVVEVL